ncbi:TetR/AcrR family transcriptional regulator [Sphingomonas sp. ABOLF]|nr:TetR/AcrR family transcriptional regulator [Sphingomonas sp. ABOLF]
MITNDSPRGRARAGADFCTAPMRQINCVVHFFADQFITFRGKRGATDLKCGERRGAGRPTREEAAAINDRVLDGARTAFCRQGISGASMDEIATAVGVTKHTIYRRYPSKAALLEAVVQRDIARFAGEMQANSDQAAAEASGPVEALKLATRRFFQCCVTPEDVAFISFPPGGGRLFGRHAPQADGVGARCQRTFARTNRRCAGGGLRSHGRSRPDL